MPKIYSYSRLESFEKCPQKFKFRYIDKIIPEVEMSIEAHLGKSVHSALEWLYSKIKENKVPTIDELIESYLQAWDGEFVGNMLIVNKQLTFKDYQIKGVEFLVSYYISNQPFDENTLELEKQIYLTLDKEGKYKLTGFIDRLSYNLKTNEYEIHDYKTANSPPSAERLKKDRQLALYSLAIKELYGEDKEVNMVWHFLAINKKFTHKKTNDELRILKQEVIALIERIESTTNFPTKVSPLCSWCEYKSICPAWGNSSQKQYTQNTITEIEDENSKPLDIWS